MKLWILLLYIESAVNLVILAFPILLAALFSSYLAAILICMANYWDLIFCFDSVLNRKEIEAA